MPKLSQYFIRAALIHLLIGFTVGGLLLAHKGVYIHPVLWRWLPAHIEFVLMGWVTQLVMGVAFWIAPRFLKAPRRGNETGAKAAFVLLNLGVFLATTRPFFGTPLWVLLLGRVLELLAVVAFGLHLWQRIVGRNFQLKNKNM